MSSATETPEEVTLPALYYHCIEIYEAMSDVATEVKMDTGATSLVYEGFLTSLVTKQQNLSVPYYTDVTRALRRMGCIKQLRRGGGTAPSQWELFHPPNQQLFETAKAPTRSKRASDVEGMQQQIRDLNERVLRLEQARS